MVYFYQKQNQAARALGAMLRQLERLNGNFRVQLIDADQNPAVASSQGVRTYNSAVLRLDERRVEVITTDDREIALGVLRLLRTREVVICFASGHGQYDIDNFEFHTHFEGAHNHSHDASGTGVVLMEQHGLGRLRRAIEKLGLVVEVLTARDLEAFDRYLRGKEIGIRASLGASRGRLIRQLLVESFVLATAGCVAGCIFAFGSLKWVVAAIPADN